MTVDEIIAEIWELPWYKVMVIAAKDDGILFIKTWWLWIPLWAFGFGVLMWTDRNKGKEKK